MNIKTSTKYQIKDYNKTIRMFYLVILLIITMSIIIAYTFEGGLFSVGGMEFSTCIFLFVVGLNSFKETFYMMMQNGISRKTMYIGRFFSFLSASVFMALLDRVILNVVSHLFNSERFIMAGMYDMIFEDRFQGRNVLVNNIEVILMSIATYMAALVAGYLITSAFYRMNKAVKLIASIGVPVLVFIILPILDSSLLNNKIGIIISDFIIFTLKAPYNLVLVCLLFVIVSMGLSWLLIRRAVSKE